MAERVRMIPSVKLLALWMAEANFLARCPGERDECRAWADANWQQFRRKAEEYQAALIAARSEPSTN